MSQTCLSEQPLATELTGCNNNTLVQRQNHAQ